MRWVAVVTAYALSGRTFDETLISWSSGNPRIVAASNEDLDSGRLKVGQNLCRTFPGGDRITYTVRDRCVACDRGEIDILVDSTKKANILGRKKMVVSIGRC